MYKPRPLKQRIVVSLDLPPDIAQKLHWLREAYAAKLNEDGLKLHLAAGKTRGSYKPVKIRPHHIVYSALVAFIKSYDKAADRLEPL